MARISVRLGASGIFVAIVAIVACDTRLPTGPSTTSSVLIVGPDSVAPGQSVRYFAVLRMTDGTSREASPADVRWQSGVPEVLRVDANGVVTAQQLGESTVTADVSVPEGSRRAMREIVAVPAGTYRLVGIISDAELPALRVSGARIEVTSSTVAASSDVDGRYRLYGVPGTADVRIASDGYEALQQNLQLTTHQTMNFALKASSPRPIIQGPYTLSIELVGACPMPIDLQRRQYDVVITSNGPMLEVTLTESRFRINSTGKGNRFKGVATPAGAVFDLAPLRLAYYYGYQGPADYPDVAERLSDDTFLVPSGEATTTGSANGWSGRLEGGIARYDSGFPSNARWVEGCGGSSHVFKLTPR